MSTDSETARVSGLGDGLGGRSTVARLDAGGSLSQEPAAPVVDETSSESGAREGSDAKLQEPLVPTVMEKSVVSKDAASRTPTQRLRRKTLILIFGQLFAAIILMIGHFLFFFFLDERLVEETSISQPWVIALSLLLATLVRGALTLSVGTSFVQYLWSVFRTEYISLADIESMFNLKGSILAILNIQMAWKVPLLFSMGVYLWLLPVALIYPPGALIVSMDAYHSLQSRNMSVLNQSFPEDFDPLDERNQFPSLSGTGLLAPDIKILNSASARISYSNNTYWGLQGRLTSFARYILSGESISRIEPPAKTSNASYILEYDAPQLNCTEIDSNATIYAPFARLSYDPSTNLTNSLRSYDIWNFAAQSSRANRDRFVIQFAQYIGYIPQSNYSLSNDAYDPGTEFGIATQLRTLSCQGYSTALRVNITNRDGRQNLTYIVHGSRVLNAPGVSFNWTDEGGGLDPENDDLDYKREIVPRESAAYKEWAGHDVPAYLRAVNTLNMFQYAFTSFEGYLGTWLDLNVTQGVDCVKNGWLEETGTQTRQVDLCPLSKVGLDAVNMGKLNMPGAFVDAKDANRRSFSNSISPIAESALNKNRFNDSAFNPLADLDITTTSLNELLANFSISLLTQNTFYDNVTVDVEEFRNIYHFTDKPGFFVPYALCLAIATVYAIIALITLRKNGLPAADGGFLQIMMTTRGNTKMERLVVEQGPRSVDEIKGALAALRVRLGETEFETQIGHIEGEEGRKVVKRLAFRTEGEYEAGRSY